jgi:hypothetical protein
MPYVYCPKCQKRWTFRARYLGRLGKCGRCGHVFRLALSADSGAQVSAGEESSSNESAGGFDFSALRGLGPESFLSGSWPGKSRLNFGGTPWKSPPPTSGS